ncbi:MAG: hypothetical protein ACTS73_09090 [Arsenophonus sp. NEOnobi-MAG3]
MVYQDDCGWKENEGLRLCSAHHCASLIPVGYHNYSADDAYGV